MSLLQNVFAEIPIRPESELTRSNALIFEQELVRKPDGPKVPIEQVEITSAIDHLIQSCEAEGLRPKTITKYRQVLDVVASFAEAHDIDDLTQIDIQFTDLYRQFRTRQGAKQKTIHNELGIIRRLLHFAKIRRMIAEYPLEDLRLTKPKTR